eukprot:gnl/MRDRNA2_/MRDRNA2_102116_c0_seq1.p1 gnl/MRDRNA2_/MRDRNA2_102116_c0~~gnl/MRDRNA2_/MRDRNA2_102116_c0_seq1.p1  ORF type:complete len:1008 (+),score=218.54 gnl/MRDRNA2_/MRDRNA2_102116_c0_seq1:46-3024(+)
MDSAGLDDELEQQRAAVLLQARYRGYASRRGIASARTPDKSSNVRHSIDGNHLRNTLGVERPKPDGVPDEALLSSLHADEFSKQELDSAINIQCAFRRRCAQQEAVRRRQEVRQREQENAKIDEKWKQVEDMMRYNPYDPSHQAPPDPDLLWSRPGSPEWNQGRYSPGSPSRFQRRHSQIHKRPSHLDPDVGIATEPGGGRSSQSFQRRHSTSDSPHKRRLSKSSSPRPQAHGVPVTDPGKKAPKFHYPKLVKNVHVQDEDKKNKHLKHIYEQRMHHMKRLHLGLASKTAEATEEQTTAATRIQAFIKAKMAQRDCALIRVIYSQARQMHLTRQSVIARKQIENSGLEFPGQSRVKIIKRQILTHILQASKKVLIMQKVLDADKLRKSGKTSDRATMNKPIKRVWAALDRVSEAFGTDGDDADHEEQQGTGRGTHHAQLMKRKTIADLEAAREDLIVNVVSDGNSSKTVFSKDKTIKTTHDGFVIKFTLEGEPAKLFETANLVDIGYVITDVPPGLKKANRGPVVRPGDRVYRVNGCEDPEEIRQLLQRSRLDPNFAVVIEVLTSTLPEADLLLQAIENQRQLAGDRVSRDVWASPWVDSMLKKFEIELANAPEAHSESIYVDDPPAGFIQEYVIAKDELLQKELKQKGYQSRGKVIRYFHSEGEEKVQVEWPSKQGGEPLIQVLKSWQVQSEKSQSEDQRQRQKTKATNLRLFKPQVGLLPVWLQSPDCYGATLRAAISELCPDQVEDFFASLTRELDTAEQIALESVLLVDEGAGTAGAEFRDGPQVWQYLLHAVEKEMEQATTHMWQQVFWKMSRVVLKTKEAALQPLAQQWSLPAVAREWTSQLALVQEAWGWADHKLKEMEKNALSGNKADRCQVALLHAEDVAAHKQTGRPATAGGVLMVGRPAIAFRNGFGRNQGVGQPAKFGLRVLRAPAEKHPEKMPFTRPGSARSAPKSARGFRTGELLPFTTWKHDVFLATLLPQSKRRMH